MSGICNLLGKKRPYDIGILIQYYQFFYKLNILKFELVVVLCNSYGILIDGSLMKIYSFDILIDIFLLFSYAPRDLKI